MSFRSLTPLEIALQGLTKHKSAPVTVGTIPGKGRGVFAAATITKGAYICEYKTKNVYPREARAEQEEQYVENEESCMILEVQTPRGWWCLDATRRWTTIGRLMNHAPAREATTKPFRALKVDKTWKVAFLATRDIRAGEELTWDYGCPPEGNRWLMRRRTKPATEGMHSIDSQSKN